VNFGFGIEQPLYCHFLEINFVVEVREGKRCLSGRGIRGGRSLAEQNRIFAKGTRKDVIRWLDE
jgi:hypothetical protein